MTNILGPHKCIEFFIIGWVAEGDTMKFFTKISNWMSTFQNTTFMPTPDPSYSSSKCFAKFGKAKMGALVS